VQRIGASTDDDASLGRGLDLLRKKGTVDVRDVSCGAIESLSKIGANRVECAAERSAWDLEAIEGCSIELAREREKRLVTVALDTGDDFRRAPTYFVVRDERAIEQRSPVRGRK
jgi:hypothetical protein